MATKVSAIIFALSFTLLLIASDVGLVEGRTICEIKGPVVFFCSNGCSQYCYTGYKCRGRRCTGYRCVRHGLRSQCYCRWRC